MRHRAWISLLLLLLSFVGWQIPCRADIIITGEYTGDPPSESHHCHEPVPHECEVTLDPLTVEYISGPSDACESAVGTDFSDWETTYNWTHPFHGTLDIVRYDAIDGDSPHPDCWMGAVMEANYTADPNDPDVDRLRWIQIIITDDPLTGKTSPYVDTLDALPFYPYNRDGSHFEDAPRRPCPCLGHTDWMAELYLVDWYTYSGQTEDKAIVIYEGVRWGFDIDCIPEPATFWLIGIGLLGLVGYGWRRRKQVA